MLVLALGLAGVALAQRSSASLKANVTLLDGKLRVSPTTFAPGKLTLVVVNQGRLKHALAIMGTGLQPKRTPALTSGRSAQLTVTIKVGMYHVWDPVQSSMSHATMLMVKAAKATSTSPVSSTGGGSSGGTSSGTGATSGGTTGGGMPGMTTTDPNDPCAGM